MVQEFGITKKYSRKTNLFHLIGVNFIMHQLSTTMTQKAVLGCAKTVWRRSKECLCDSKLLNTRLISVLSHQQ